MKLTKSQLKRIIKEELESTIEEGIDLPPEPKVTGVAAGKTPEYTIIVQVPWNSKKTAIWDDGEPYPGLERARVAASGLELLRAHNEEDMDRKIAAINRLKLKPEGVGLNFIAAYKTSSSGGRIRPTRLGAPEAVHAVLTNPMFTNAVSSPVYKWSSPGLPELRGLEPEAWEKQLATMREGMLKQMIKEELAQVLRESQRAA